MNTMDNAQVIKALEKVSLQKYLFKLINASLNKVTLFSCFPHTGAPNISDAHNFVMIDDLSVVAEFNSGKFLN